MKKIITVIYTLSFVIGAVSAQSVYDGVKIADKDLNGTARFVGMGGAMGALGGDITTMGTNPAGIGIYRSNDVMTSFSYSAYGMESKYEGQKSTIDKNRWSFDNIGVVFATKIGNQTPLRYVNFGFNYKRSKSFYKNMSMSGMMGELRILVIRDLHIMFLKLILWLYRQLMQNDMFGIILGSTWILIMQIGYSQILMLDGLGLWGIKEV